MNGFSFTNTSVFPKNQTLIMGIINYTPDSFSDGGKFFTVESALNHALQLQNEGADILDLGACSTKPNGKLTTEAEERTRLEQVLPVLLQNVRLPISVDTFYPENARLCLSLGAKIINDVSGVIQPEMAKVIKEYGAGWVIMHGGVNSKIGERENNYPLGVTNHVQLFFDEVLEQCAQCGISKEQICFDPGFGFGKTVLQNIELLKNISLLQTNGVMLMAALSRKRFIGYLSKEENPENRLGGTLGADIFCALNGVGIIRTHEVFLHKKALLTIDAIK